MDAIYHRVATFHCLPSLISKAIMYHVGSWEHCINSCTIMPIMCYFHYSMHFLVAPSGSWVDLQLSVYVGNANKKTKQDL